MIPKPQKYPHDPLYISNHLFEELKQRKVSSFRKKKEKLV